MQAASMVWWGMQPPQVRFISKIKMSCVANNGVVSLQPQPALVRLPFNDSCEAALTPVLAGRQTAATPPKRGAAARPGGPTPLCSAGKTGDAGPTWSLS